MSLLQFLVYSRSGDLLYNTVYSPVSPAPDPTAEDERCKLVFGLLFSLKELTASLSPPSTPSAPSAIDTPLATLHVHETATGYRFCAFSAPGSPPLAGHLKAVFEEVWVPHVSRSPLWGGGGVAGRGFGVALEANLKRNNLR
jgi:hypothetical protein